MGQYDTQQVCMNGHQITDMIDSKPQHGRKFCPTCGAKTISQCLKCNAKIPGYYHQANVFSTFSAEVPTHCENCGEAFPWAKLKQQVSLGDIENEIDNLKLIEQLCSKFHLIARQLKDRHDDRDTLVIEDEYDVQDLLHSLLHIYFDDIRPEEWTPSYAGGSSRVDFLLKSEQIIIEVKKTRKSLKGKNIGEELIIDMKKYQVHPDCKQLFCFVYDPDGWVSNPNGLENDLNSEEEDFVVKVLIVPKGH